MRLKITLLVVFLFLFFYNCPLKAEIKKEFFHKSTLSLTSNNTKIRFPNAKISDLKVLETTLIKEKQLLQDNRTLKPPLNTKKRSTLVALASKFLNTPYRWGGTGPGGFDCTGFVYYLYKSIGIPIPRTIESMYGKGNKVSKQELNAGDILFFVNTFRRGLSHVGMYLGGNKFIHASSHGRGVRIDNIDSSYFINKFFGAKQIIR